jgi:hypothetical protein
MSHTILRLLWGPTGCMQCHAPSCTTWSHTPHAESMLQTTIEKERVLNEIMEKKRPSAANTSANERVEAVSKLREIPEWSVPHYLNDLYELSLPVENSSVTSFTDRITELVAQVCLLPESGELQTGNVIAGVLFV